MQANRFPFMLIIFLLVAGAWLGIFDGLRNSVSTMINTSNTSDTTALAKTQMLQVVAKIDADMPIIQMHTQNMKRIWSDAVLENSSEDTRKYVFSFGQYRSYDEAINLYLTEPAVQADISAINSRKVQILAELSKLEVPSELMDEYVEMQEVYALYAYYSTMLSLPRDSYDSFAFLLNTAQYELSVAMQTVKVKIESQHTSGR
jgi:hypothetical protein